MQPVGEPLLPCLPECIEEAGIAFYRLFPLPVVQRVQHRHHQLHHRLIHQVFVRRYAPQGAAQQIQFHFRSLLYLHRQNTLPYSLSFLSAAKVL